SPSRPTSRPTANDAAPVAGGHPTSTPTCTSSATSSNAPSPCSSSGAHWPPGMTSTPPSTAAPSSSPQSSPGYAVRRHALEHLGQEGLGTGVLRGGEHLDGHPLLHDDSPVHEHESVAHLSREPHLVSDDHHGHALGSEQLHDVEDLPDELGVKSGGGLVERSE